MKSMTQPLLHFCLGVATAATVLTFHQITLTPVIHSLIPPAFLSAFPFIFVGGPTESLILLSFSFIVFLGLYRLFQLFFIPLDVYILDTVSDRESPRKAGDLPPPYPNGWYLLLYSHELKEGEKKHIRVLGHNLVVFRSTTENGSGRSSTTTTNLGGKVGVLDAYCSHMGANLGVGGQVVGNCIQCPFHGWKFDMQGRCTSIPYSDTIPKIANIRSWPVMERNGMILMYFDIEGNPPSWEIPLLPEIDSKVFRFDGKTEHRVSAHIQEIPENGADVRHLTTVHSPSVVEWLNPHMVHGWEATWAVCPEPENHTARGNLMHQIAIFGYPLPITKIYVVFTQVGPGIVVLEFTTPLGRLIILSSVTPMAPLYQKSTHAIWSEKKVPRCIGKLILWATYLQFIRDIPIWSNKTFVPRPMVVKHDGPISQFRRWFSQFYSKNPDAYKNIDISNNALTPNTKPSCLDNSLDW